MADAKVSWQADPTPGITGYTVQFTLTPAGGSAQPSVSANVPRDAGADASGYSFNYSALTPTPAALADGDVVSASVSSTNPAGTSPLVPSVPSSITISIAPPTPTPTGPLNVTLAQV